MTVAALEIDVHEAAGLRALKARGVASCGPRFRHHRWAHVVFDAAVIMAVCRDCGHTPLEVLGSRVVGL